MIHYKEEELIAISILSKSLGRYINKVISHPLNRLVITQNNKPEAVIIPIAEYELMKNDSDYLENMQIAAIIKERVLDKKEPIKMITEDDMNRYLNTRGIINIED